MSARVLKAPPLRHTGMNLHAALRVLRDQNASTLAYEQCIDVRSIDPGFAPLTRYQIETLRLQFPPEAVCARNFRSSSPCKIVAYQQVGPMIEIEVKQGMEIAILPETVCLIYTRSKKDFRVWFELVLRKATAKL